MNNHKTTETSPHYNEYVWVSTTDLENWLAQTGMTQDQAGKMIGRTGATISKWLKDGKMPLDARFAIRYHALKTGRDDRKTILVSGARSEVESLEFFAARFNVNVNAIEL